jgi:VWFA-related protein
MDTLKNMRHPLSRIELLLSLFFVLGNSASGRAQEPPAGRISTIVDMVGVGVTVTDSNGKFVTHLRNSDFKVSDNGAEQQISYFEADRPTDVLVLIEAGPAVFLIEGGHLRAASALIQGLSERDRVAVVRYAEKPEGVSDFSTNKVLAFQAFDHLNFNLGFGALNLSDSLSTLLDWLEKTPSRQTIVLLSSGVDTSSSEAHTKLMQRLRVSGPRILAVSLLGELRTPNKPGKKQTLSQAAVLTAPQFDTADQTLRELAALTGGRAYFPVDSKGFAAAYQEIAEIVGHQYVLGFPPPVHDEKVHALGVQIAVDPADPPDGIKSYVMPLRVDHRQAYLAHKSAAKPLPDGLIGSMQQYGRNLWTYPREGEGATNDY